MEIYLEENNRHLPQTKEAAIDQGITKYFTGVPCDKGHVTFRWVSNHSCGLCARDKRIKNRETSKAKRLKLLHAAKYRCSKRGVEFNLSVEDIIIPDVCPVLGIPIVSGGGGFSFNSPSIDRIDPNKGYTADNIQIISWRANKLKSDASFEEFLAVFNYMTKLRGLADTLKYNHQTGRLELFTITEFE